MQDYYRIYMQQERDGAAVKDTIASFGMYCMENPFNPCESVKDITKRSWYDEHGDDEYIGSDGLYLAAYENEVKFGFNGTAFAANKKLKDFIDYLMKGQIKMYCEFNRIGRQHVRLKSIKPTLERDPVNEDILIVKVTFKFNDPKTDIEPVTDTDGNVVNLA